MMRFIAAGLLVAFAAITTGAGISNADVTPVEGNYVTQTACLNDGTRFGQLDVASAHGHVLPRFYCEQHNDSRWYLFLIR